jgi:hypothetical protein
MKVKLQPATRSELPAYNPILPIIPITQIMLIANPNDVILLLLFFIIILELKILITL